MRTAMTALSLLAAFVTAAALYVLTYDTRRLEARVLAEEQRAERLEVDIAAARAELAHLSRPERIEPIARALGLSAPGSSQFVDEQHLPRRKASPP